MTAKRIRLCFTHLAFGISIFTGVHSLKHRHPVRKPINCNRTVSAPSICNTPGCQTAAKTLLENMNQSADPCANFYQYACGSFKERHPLPDDQSSQNYFKIIEDRVAEEMRVSWKPVRRFRLDCQNPLTLLGAITASAWIQLGGWPVMDIVCSRSAKNLSLSDVLIAIRRNFVYDPLWSLAVEPDDKNVSRMVLTLDDASPMMTRDFYLNNTGYAKKLEAYKVYIADTASLLGEDANQRADRSKLKLGAGKILELEKRLAKKTRSKEDKRDPMKRYYRWTIGKLVRTFDFFPWEKYFDAIMPAAVRSRINNSTVVVIRELAYLKKLGPLMRNINPSVLIAYAMWRTIQEYSLQLDGRFHDIEQKFMKTYNGREKLPARWKFCVERTIDTFPAATGAIYVDKKFSADEQKEASSLVEQFRQTLSKMISDLRWMDAETRQRALLKLKNMGSLVGYPDYLRDGGRLDDHNKHLLALISPDDAFFETKIKANLASQIRSFEKLRRPTERFEFEEPATTVNAFYLPSANLIKLPAAILRPPYFHGDFPRAVNFGAIGSVIGHEFTHGFDDQGRQFDETGNLRVWWSNYSKKAFLERARCIVDQYSAYSVDLGNSTPPKTINGNLTQGENIADNGGLKQAFKAYQNSLVGQSPELPLPGVNLTNDQLFFVAFASTWCGYKTNQAQHQDLLDDEHSPGKFRVIGSVSNSADFARSFNCPVGYPMNPKRKHLIRMKCDVW